MANSLTGESQMGKPDWELWVKGWSYSSHHLNEEKIGNIKGDTDKGHMSECRLIEIY